MISTYSAMLDQHWGLLLQLTIVSLGTAGSEDSQARHVQDGPASVSDDAGEEAHPSRNGIAENASSAAAITSSGRTVVSDLTNVCVYVH